MKKGERRAAPPAHLQTRDVNALSLYRNASSSARYCLRILWQDGWNRRLHSLYGRLFNAYSCKQIIKNWSTMIRAFTSACNANKFPLDENASAVRWQRTRRWLHVAPCSAFIWICQKAPRTAGAVCGWRLSVAHLISSWQIFK